MVEFLLGLIIGLLLFTAVFVILAYFRAGIEKRVRIIENVLGEAGPKEKGAIFLPDSEATIARNKIIKKNKERGTETRFDELR